MEPRLWETEENSAHFGTWKSFNIRESNLRFSSYLENTEFLRPDFQNRFRDIRLRDISLAMFAARYNFNAYKADEYVYKWNRLNLQCELVIVEKFRVLGCQVFIPTYLHSALQEISALLAK
jgi:hypothetical protein